MAIVEIRAIQKANRQVRLFIFLCFLCSGTSLKAQLATNSQLDLAYDHLLNYRIDSCQLILEKAAKTPYNYYLQLLSTTTFVLLSEDQDIYKSHKDYEAEIYSSIEENAFSEAESGFLKAEIRLQWGFLKLKYGDEFSGFWNLKQAFNLAKTTAEKYPEYLPAYKTIGLLHTVFGLTPEKYNWVLSLFGLEGDVPRGLSELQKVANSQENLFVESHVIISMLQAYLLGNPAMGASEMGLAYSRKQTTLTNYLYSLVLMKNGQSESALQIINNTPQAKSLVYFNYLKGEIYLQKGQYDDSRRYFEVFLEMNQGESLRKDAFYKIAICHHLQGNEKLCNANLDKVIHSGSAKNEADKYAESEAISKSLSNPELYKLRYATDGGYFEMAKKIYSEIDPESLSKKDQCEFYYRTARLNHKIGDISIAIHNYKKTMDVQLDEAWYFGPNSALQLATIFVSQKNYNEARSMLDKLDSYKEYPYRGSIRQQSKSLRESID